MAQVTLRYWAALKAAAGKPEADMNAATLAEAEEKVRAAHGEGSEFTKILRICSVLVDDIPVGLRNHEHIRFRDGAVVDFLPPFAGG